MDLSWKELNGSSESCTDTRGILVTRPVRHLKPHPSWSRHNVSVASVDLNQQAETDCSRFNPLLITRDLLVIEGYAQLEFAKRSGLVNIDCLECDISEEDALRLLLARHQRFQFLNQFIRICMALDLEPNLQRTALSNQSLGGKNKGSSNLSEAERIDVRSEIAKIACTCSSNVSKVKQLLRLADPQVLQVVHNGEIHIDRAWQWKDLSQAQQKIALDSWKCDKRLNRRIEILLSRHIKKKQLSPHDPTALISRLAAFKTRDNEAIRAVVVHEPGMFICISRDLLERLPAYQTEL